MAVSVEQRELLLIGGQWTEAAGGERFTVTDPASGELVGSVPDAQESDVRAAIDAAAAALEGWRCSAASGRAGVLRRAGALLRERRSEIAAVMTSEQGKPLAEAAGEVDYAASFLEWFAGEAERVYGQVVPPANPRNRVLVLRQAVGVTAAITPWNFPAAMLTRKLGPALAAGCTAVVKPASATPLTAALVLRALEDAGAPAGVVNLVTSRSAQMVAETLFGDARVRKVSFTGSTEVGKELIRLSAAQVKRLSLELGGHAPYIVFDDADLEQALDGLIASKFRNAGQTCVCANRVYVQRGIYDTFCELLRVRVSELTVGPGTSAGVDIGPLIDERAVAHVAEQVRDALANGGRLLVGGERLSNDAFARGCFYAPTVIADMTPSMLVANEETFGPVAAVAPFSSEKEAIELANASSYGLAAYFHTRDYARLIRVAERLEYGIVGVNSGLISTANVPFGGVKESGYGREGGSFGIDEYLDIKYVLVADVESSST
jgi:succinate-semialdehyde dehydrogenase/glutarate-semialdehyde dehydrogenase